MVRNRPRPTIKKLQEAGRVLADYAFDPGLKGYMECNYCGLAHAHTSDCIVGKWLAAGGNNSFTKAAGIDN